MRTSGFDKETKVFIAIAATVVLCIVAVVILAVRDHSEWSAWCEGHGGHVVSDTKTVTVIQPNGGVGTGTTTTNYCLSPTGAIIDIE